jgi:hypothetical protein
MRKLLIVLAAFAFVVAYSVPAMAAEADFYGSIRMLTFNTSLSKEQTTWGTTDDDDLAHVLSGSGKLGARAKVGDVGGHFEMSNSFTLRLMYAYWEGGFGKLVVGQDYTPTEPLFANMAYGDNSMTAYGLSYAGRQPQVKLVTLGGALQVALMTNVVVSASGFTPTETDTSIPKIEASYSLKLGPVSLSIFGGMNSHDDVVITGASEKTYSIDSNLLGVAFKIPVGALYLNGEVWMSQNPKNYGQATLAKAANAAAYNTANDGIDDAEAMVYALIVGYKISDMLKIEGGYALIHNEIDQSGVTTEAETNFFYVQLPVTLAKNVYIIPEIGSADYGDLKVGSTETKQGDMSYWGVKWQIDF